MSKFNSENDLTKCWLSMNPDFGNIEPNAYVPEDLVCISDMLKSAGIDIAKYVDGHTGNKNNIKRLNHVLKSADFLNVNKTGLESGLDNNSKTGNEIKKKGSESKLKSCLSQQLTTEQKCESIKKLLLRSSLSDNVLTSTKAHTQYQNDRHG